MGLVPALLALSACPQDEPEVGTASIRIQLEAASLEADGVRTVRVRVFPLTESGTPDNRVVTMTVSDGTLLSDTVEIDPDGLSGRFTPENGVVVFEYRCPAQRPGVVNFTAENGVATGRGSVNCVNPTGTYLLSVNADDCADIVASGSARCAIDVEMTFQTASLPFPAEGVQVNAQVVEAVALSGEDTAIRAVLAEEEDGALSSEASATTDVQGKARIWLGSPRLGLAQSITLDISGVAPDQGTFRETLDVTIGPFSNRAALTMSINPLSVATGQSATVFLTAIDPVGDPASGAAVVLQIPSGTGGALVAGAEEGESVTVVLDEAGFGTAQLRAPSAEGELVQVVVTARYTPSPDLAVIERESTVSVYPEDALILNVTADPDVIRSDQNTSTLVRATLSRFTAGTLQPVVGRTVTFRIQSSDAARLQFGARPEPLPPTYSPTLTLERMTSLESVEEGPDIGVATAVVATQNDRVRGRGIVEVYVEEGAERVRATVEILMERDPVLQSLVFVEAIPVTIGVRGSAYPSASELQFRILDDLNAPIAGVPVRFDVNATADPEASVQTEGFTDEAGVVTTVLSAGTQTGPISVIATATVGGRTLVTESLPVVVTGGLPAFANSYLVCEAEQSAAEAPFSADCRAILVDRFTNRAPTNIGVHFRAEGGNISPFAATDNEGRASATFATGLPGKSTASLLSASGESWSYASVLPYLRNDLATSATFDADARFACFDDLSRTECDLVGMCRTPLNEAYCPLPPDFAVPEDDCWEHLNAFALTGRAEDIGPELLLAVAQIRSGNQNVTPGDQSDAQNFLVNQFDVEDINALNYYIDDNPSATSLHEYVRAVVNVYLENQFRCGTPTSCITARGAGLGFVDHDDCPINYGCIDFSTSTECPQDGLLTVTASFRGEESFLDTNGNGQFDYIDVDGNHRHDRGEPAMEPWIDMPEPYLDRNNNCIYDDLSASLRLQPIDRVRHSDLFSDVDGSGSFGFRDLESEGSPNLYTNQQWDRDTHLFATTHLLQLSEPVFFEYGQPCSLLEVGTEVECDLGDRFAALGLPRRALCEEAGPSGGLARACVAPVFSEASSLSLRVSDALRVAYRWRDVNGNCFSPGFSSVASVTSEPTLNLGGTVERTLDTDYCGFFVTPNPNRPWCTDQRALGAETLTLSVSPNCEGIDSVAGPILSDITFELDDLARTVTVRTQCPVCGDGRVEGNEQCDDGNRSPDDGCSDICQNE